MNLFEWCIYGVFHTHMELLAMMSSRKRWNYNKVKWSASSCIRLWKIQLDTFANSVFFFIMSHSTCDNGWANAIAAVIIHDLLLIQLMTLKTAGAIRELDGYCGDPMPFKWHPPNVYTELCVCALCMWQCDTELSIRIIN